MNHDRFTAPELPFFVVCIAKNIIITHTLSILSEDELISSYLWPVAASAPGTKNCASRVASLRPLNIAGRDIDYSVVFNYKQIKKKPTLEWKSAPCSNNHSEVIWRVQTVFLALRNIEWDGKKNLKILLFWFYGPNYTQTKIPECTQKKAEQWCHQ